MPLRVGPLRRIPSNLASIDEEAHGHRGLFGEEYHRRADLYQIHTAAEPVVSEGTTGPLDTRMAAEAIRSGHAALSSDGTPDFYATENAERFGQYPCEVGLGSPHVPGSGGSTHGSECNTECVIRSK